MNAMFAILGLSGTELIIVLVAILVLFGAKRIPEFAKGLGKGINEFKKASREVTDSIENEPAQPPRQNASGQHHRTVASPIRRRRKPKSSDPRRAEWQPQIFHGRFFQRTAAGRAGGGRRPGQKFSRTPRRFPLAAHQDRRGLAGLPDRLPLCRAGNRRHPEMAAVPCGARARERRTQGAGLRRHKHASPRLDLTTNQIGGIDLGTNWFTVVASRAGAGRQQHFAVAFRWKKIRPRRRCCKSATDLVYLDPAAPFFSSMQLAFYGGILLASPVIFFFVAQFVLPALKIREKKYVLRAAFIGVGLFLAGVAFCYFFVLARALKFAEWWALWMGVKVPEWRAETYFSFVTKFLLGMGLGFELPVVLLALVKIGMLDYQKADGAAPLHDRHQPGSRRAADHAGTVHAGRHGRGPANPV